MICPLRLDVVALEIGSPPIIDSALLKKHVRVDTDADNDLLDVYVQAAVNWCEGAGVTNRTVVRRAHTWILREFNSAFPYEIKLPKGKTSSVESVEYSLNGELVTLHGPTSDVSPAGTGYQEDLRGDSGGVLMPVRGNAWPTVDRDVPAPVVINFTAGWAADEIPSDLLHAILFAVADAYDLRGTADFSPQMLDTSGPRLSIRYLMASGYALPRIY